MQAFNRYIATSHVWFSATMMLLAIGLFITAWIIEKFGSLTTLHPNNAPMLRTDKEIDPK